MFRRRALHKKSLLWMFASLLLVSGCATTKPEQQVRLVWPPPPEKARIEFVRSINSDRDLNQEATFSTKLVNFLSGAKPQPNEVDEPMGLAVSDDGNVVYVSDYAQNKVFVFDFGKRYFRKIEGVAWPAGLALDNAGNLYVVEQRKKQITVFDPAGKLLRSITDKSVERPVGIAIDRERGRIYLGDTAYNQSKEFSVKIFSLDGKLLGKIGKGRGDGPGQFLFPTFLAVDHEGNLYVTDSLNCRVEKFAPDGKYVKTFGGRGDAWGMFTRPKGVALDGFGNLYVVDSGWSNVQIFNQKGQILLFFGGRGPIPGMLKNPISIAIDIHNYIFIGDYLNHRIEEYRLVNTTAADSIATSTPAAPPSTPEIKPMPPKG